RHLNDPNSFTRLLNLGDLGVCPRISLCLFVARNRCRSDRHAPAQNRRDPNRRRCTFPVQLHKTHCARYGVRRLSEKNERSLWNQDWISFRSIWRLRKRPARVLAFFKFFKIVFRRRYWWCPGVLPIVTHGRAYRHWRHHNLLRRGTAWDRPQFSAGTWIQLQVLRLILIECHPRTTAHV